MGTKAVGVKIALLLLASMWLVGCVQTKTTPGYARAGDHIIIGLGGAIRNANGNAVIKASDLSIVLTDHNNQQFTLEPRMIFKSHLDYSALLNSQIFDGTTASAGVGLTGMVPYDGGWFVLAPLTYPGQYNNPLPLAAGAASISVSSPKLTNTANSVEGDLDYIPIEIIPGTSAQDTDFIRQFAAYTPTPSSFLMRPSNLNGVTDIGGAYLVINYTNDALFKQGIKPVVVPGDHNPYVQMNYNVVPNGGGTGTIYVTLLNPVGFKTPATAGPNSSYLSDLSVRLNYFPKANTTTAQFKSSFSVDNVKSHYIRTDGSTIYGLYPVLTHAEDL